MATVKERFDRLGLAYSQAVLEQFGNHIKTVFARTMTNPFYVIPKVHQREGNQWLMVNYYPDDFIQRMDQEILEYLTHRPDEREKFRIRQWWLSHKQLPQYRYQQTQPI